jgi:hypothetical protein
MMRVSGGKHAARKLKRAQILLAADAGASDEDIIRDVGVGGSTVYRTKRRFVLGNLEAAPSEEPRPGAKRKLSGKESAAGRDRLLPAGRARWTLELLAGDGPPHRTCQYLAGNRPSALGRKRFEALAQGDVVIPEVDAEYVDVLIAASKVSSNWSPKPPSGKNGATRLATASNGCSQPRKPEPKWARPIHGLRLTQVTLKDSKPLCSGTSASAAPSAESKAATPSERRSTPQERNIERDDQKGDRGRCRIEVFMNPENCRVNQIEHRLHDQ